MPAAYIPSLVALAVGAAGVLVGLFIGFVPEPHLGALRRARASRTTELREGDHVCLEGTLATTQPLEGPISQAPTAVMRLEYYGRQEKKDVDEDNSTEHRSLRLAPGVVLDDGHGRVAFELDEGTLLTTKRWSATEHSMGPHRWAQVAMRDTVTFAEASIAVGAKVLLVGEAAWVNKTWTIRGRDAFLTDVARDELDAKARRSRLAGIGVMVLSVCLGIGVAAVLALAD